MSTISPPEGVEITAEVPPEGAEILTNEALALVAKLHREPSSRGARSCWPPAPRAPARSTRAREPDFLPETAHIRDDTSWRVAPAPADLQDRRVEITGPVDRKMIINALNSGAKVFMADFEDSNTPTWDNTIQGQINLRDAVDGTIALHQPGRQGVRARREPGDPARAPARLAPAREARAGRRRRRSRRAIFDLALYMFHNAHDAARQGLGAVLLPAQDGEPPRGAPLERHLPGHPGRDRHPAGQHPRHGPDRDHPRRVRDGRDPLRAARALGRASTAGAGTTSSASSRSSAAGPTSCWPTAPWSR